MKTKVTLLSAIYLILSASSFGQNQNIEKFNTYRIGFFTNKLSLSSKEAEKFWPVYNEYQEQKTRIQAEKISLIRTFNTSAGTLSDSQLTEIGDKLVGCIVKESELAVNFHKKLREVLNPEKVIRFYQVENQYKAQLLNELQQKRGAGPNPGQKQGQNMRQEQVPEL